MPPMPPIKAYFFGEPGGDFDKAANAIFEYHGGRHIGSGTMIAGAAAGERDVEYDIPDPRAAEACRAALKKAGFRLEPTR